MGTKQVANVKLRRAKNLKLEAFVQFNLKPSKKYNYFHKVVLSWKEMSSIHLPVEILYNIFGRLRVKEIIKLTCVCKTRRDLVTHPDFISTHLNHQADSYRYLMQHWTGHERSLFSVAEDRAFVEHSNLEVPFTPLVGSVNGLLCLSDSFERYGRNLYLWNPSIWKLKILRASCFRRNFHREGNTFTLGFAFHRPTNDYMTVRVKDDSRFILAFDFCSEKLGEIMLPKYLDDEDSQSHIYVVKVEALRESLAVIVSECKTPEAIERYDIWLMKEYGMVESWGKQYSFAPVQTCSRCLSIVKNSDLVLFTEDEKGFIFYDFDKLEDKPIGFDLDVHTLTTYQESLVLYKEGIRLTPRKNLLVEGGIHLGKRKWSVFMLLQQKWL